MDINIIYYFLFLWSILEKVLCYLDKYKDKIVTNIFKKCLNITTKPYPHLYIVLMSAMTEPCAVSIQEYIISDLLNITNLIHTNMILGEQTFTLQSIKITNLRPNIATDKVHKAP